MNEPKRNIYESQSNNAPEFKFNETNYHIADIENSN